MLLCQVTSTVIAYQMDHVDNLFKGHLLLYAQAPIALHRQCTSTLSSRSHSSTSTQSMCVELVGNTLAAPCHCQCHCYLKPQSSTSPDILLQLPMPTKSTVQHSISLHTCTTKSYSTNSVTNPQSHAHLSPDKH